MEYPFGCGPFRTIVLKGPHPFQMSHRPCLKSPFFPRLTMDIHTLTLAIDSGRRIQSELDGNPSADVVYSPESESTIQISHFSYHGKYFSVSDPTPALFLHMIVSPTRLRSRKKSMLKFSQLFVDFLRLRIVLISAYISVGLISAFFIICRIS